MTTIAIKKKLMDYISHADEKKIKAIYTLVENDINEHLLDEAFVTEMEKRLNDYKTGKDKGYTWDEVKQNIKTLRSKNKRIA
jgi:putative addiction module component (TIGR02574 family)